MPEGTLKPKNPVPNLEKSKSKLADAEKISYDSLKNDQGQSMLHIAAKNNHLEMIKLMIGKSMDLTAKCKVGRTPLHYAAEGGYDEAVRILLEAGGLPNALDNNGNSPLHLAAAKNQKTVVGYLIKSGADLNLVNSSNESPLQLTTDDQVKQLLQSEGANQV